MSWLLGLPGRARSGWRGVALVALAAILAAFGVAQAGASLPPGTALWGRNDFQDFRGTTKDPQTGRATVVDGAGGSRVERAYDKAGRLVRESVSLGGRALWDVEQTWDASTGRRASMTVRPAGAAGRRQEFAYDAAGALAEVRQAADGAPQGQYELRSSFGYTTARSALGTDPQHDNLTSR